MKRKELIHDLRAIGFLAEAHQVLEYGADQIGETGEPSPSSASEGGYIFLTLGKHKRCGWLGS